MTAKLVSVGAHTRRSPRKPDTYHDTHFGLRLDVMAANLSRAMDDDFARVAAEHGRHLEEPSFQPVEWSL